ncbi:MAG: hypothetical protein QXG00_06045 [Candidatus Woesearchaeota archaeon]
MKYKMKIKNKKTGGILLRGTKIHKPKKGKGSYKRITLKNHFFEQSESKYHR